MTDSADLVLEHARIATLDPTRPTATSLAVKDGRVLAVGDDADVVPHRGPATRVIDCGGRTVVPGLNDSHLHLIRGGLNYNLELRWDGVRSLHDALTLLRDQAARTPPPHMEQQLFEVVRHLVTQRWPFRLHATYDESIRRFLDVFERVDREVPFDGLRWWFDHAETITPGSIDRVAALRGGIAVQDRMAFQGERFVARYGPQAAAEAPPIRRMLAAGLPVGVGSDATRVSSFNPWVTLHWLVTGETLGGLAARGPHDLLDRTEALRLHTSGSAWFSSEEDVKGVLAPGRYADLAVLSDDYFSVPAASIRDLHSVLTVVDGRVVHGSAEFAGLAPAAPKPSPGWSPVGHYGAFAHDHGAHACGDGGCW